MLSYLLDENLSPTIATQMRLKEPEIRVVSIHHWREGIFIGQADSSILLEAQKESLTLVTYDLKTIPTLLMELASENQPHAGVLFVDDATFRSNDFGGIVKALLAHWQIHSEEDWTDRIAFLAPAPSEM